MKTMKGRILKKLKSIPQIADLKQGRVLHLKASDGFFLHSSPRSSFLQDCREEKPPFMGTAEPMRDLDDEEDDDKENIKPPPIPPASWRKTDQDETNHKFSPFRRPDLNSSTLFDPNLLAAFEQAVKDYIRTYEESKSRISAQMLGGEEEEEAWGKKVAGTNDPLNGFEKCLPGGSGAVIFYTTTLRGVRKTFEDCRAIRFLLESSKVLFYEKDVSMHREFREEMQRVLGLGVIPPRLFVDGRYIGGAEEVLGMHEQGRLMPILKEMPVDRSGGLPCRRCGGERFLVCEGCYGSRKIYNEAGGGLWKDCGLCNENGLVVCPLCCC